MDKTRPSSVFLALWRDRTLSCSPTVEEFADMAETWMQIREMEAIALSPWSVNDIKISFAGEGSGSPEDIGATAPDPEPAPEAEAEAGTAFSAEGWVPFSVPKRSESDIGKKSFATRKRNILAALDRARSDGVTLQQISEAGRNLTLTQTLDAIDRKPLPLPVWTGLEKALGKLGYPPSQEARVDPAEPNIDASSASIEEAF